ncbi:hypothetical protein EIN_201600 [Entamoeba invadens IP1]|uniref:Uncharacterized protein n=1 Tax=Entamoeba invadens IP1 TaxID=370355 RepID=A0A0A1UBM9_ENTIV|nr:hypothetical protein EIN_201600 [Entamoeba invadens IP1]ELP89635.1 hypothetical protein EIN_201600 [Entamoeba invadens IP1]|eukprot:XP_004256406.1 hypothetical protein EIN_201600 [Entamoeba invadens IP1]
MFLILFAPVLASSLKDKITTHEVTLPANLLGGESNWRIYTISQLSSNTNNILRIDTFNEYSVRGLYTKPDGSYGVLLWNTNTSLIYFRKVDETGKEVYTKHLELQQQWIPSSVLAESDKGYGIGDSRVNYGDGKFHIYTHVHSDPTEDSKQGHEGDALFTVTDDGEVEKVWPWGCSHMMSGLQGWNNKTKTMIHVCDFDSYPGLGIFAENSDQYTLYQHAANRGGCTAG